MVQKSSVLLLAGLGAVSCSPAGEPANTPGAGSGDATGSAQPTCEPTLRAMFVASVSQVEGTKSKFGAHDTRAGSVEVEFLFGCGPNPDVRFATSSASANLRNGTGLIVEQWLLNNRYQPVDLDGRGCSPDGVFPQCWRAVPDDLVDGRLAATLPTYSDGSNTNFDLYGSRPTIEGDVSLNLGDLAGDDVNGQLVVRWEVKAGLDTARLNLRLQSLTTEAGESADVPYVLYRVRWPGDGPDAASPAIALVEQSDTTMTVSLDVRKVVARVLGGADDDGCAITSEGLLIDGSTLRWKLTNDSLVPLTLTDMELRWPESAGALLAVAVDGMDVTTESHTGGVFTLNHGWESLGDGQVLDQGESETLELRFETAPDLGWNPDELKIHLGFSEGCTKNFDPKKDLVPGQGF